MGSSNVYGKLWNKGDWNGYFGLFVNILTNTLVLTTLLLYVVKIPSEVVFGTILPGVGLSIAVGNIYYAIMAKKLANKEKRNDVTALPYGTGVEHIFICVFVVMAPVYWKTGDPILAWQIGIAWCVIEGLIEIFGAFFANTIKKITPQAAMLGSLGGLALAYIVLKPAIESWEVPYISFIGIALFLVGWIAKKELPWGVSPGIVMLIGGTCIAWISGFMRPEELLNSISSVGFSSPKFNIKGIIIGMQNIAPYLAVAIPLGLGNVLGAVDNVESAEVAGDKYSVKEVMLADGIGTLIGASFGNPFPTTVYIGHPGWKEMGSHIGYSLATGFSILIVCLFGLTPVLIELIPIHAVLPILVYIGLVIGAQSFQVIPRSHAPAVIFAMIPWVANWGLSLVDGALSAAGTNIYANGILNNLNSEGILYNGLQSLGSGPIVSSMIIASMVVFLIEEDFIKAIYCCGLAVICSFFGLMHASSIGFGVATNEALGYLMMGIIFSIIYVYNKLNKKESNNFNNNY